MASITITFDPEGLNDFKQIVADFIESVDRMEAAVSELTDDECRCESCRCDDAIGRC